MYNPLYIQSPPKASNIDASLPNNELPQILPTTNLPPYLLERAGLEATLKANISGRNPEAPAAPNRDYIPTQDYPENKKGKIINERLKEGLIQPS